jgi:hypothetical protein
MLSDVWLLHK